MEGVLDGPTLLALYELIRKKVIKKIYGVVSTGKEACVYWAKGFQDEDLAVKIYLTSTAEFKKSIWKYIAGDPRFDRIDMSDFRKVIFAWTRKEYRNLVRLSRAGVRVPEPIAFYRNILVMEFIGKNGARAPLLKEAYEADMLSKEELVEIFNTIIQFIQRAYCIAKLVHADLSEYNIMVTEKAEPVIIDVSQAVDRDHPLAHEFLARDIKNIHRFFSKEAGLEIQSIEELYEKVIECTGG